MGARQSIVYAGVFGGRWRVYRDVPLEDFESTQSKKDRMLLPGMESVPDILDTVIQTAASIFQLVRRVPIPRNTWLQ
jgi:hypothetical protein